MSVETIDLSGCAACCDECVGCANASSLSISGPGGSGTLTIDGGDPDTPPNTWHGTVGGCEFWVFCNEVAGEYVYTAEVGSFTCITPQAVDVTVNSCDPLDLTIHVDKCCTNGDWTVTE